MAIRLRVFGRAAICGAAACGGYLGAAAQLAGSRFWTTSSGSSPRAWRHSEGRRQHASVESTCQFTSVVEQHVRAHSNNRRSEGRMVFIAHLPQHTRPRQNLSSGFAKQDRPVADPSSTESVALATASAKGLGFVRKSVARLHCDRAHPPLGRDGTQHTYVRKSRRALVLMPWWHERCPRRALSHSTTRCR